MWRRVLLVIVLALALAGGAVVTTGVAWTFASIDDSVLEESERFRFASVVFRDEATTGEYRGWTAPGRTAIIVHPRPVADQPVPDGAPRRPLPSWSERAGRVETPPRMRHEYAFGWPWPALRVTWTEPVDVYYGADDPFDGGRAIAPIGLRSGPRVAFLDHPALPMRIVPRGFAASAAAGAIVVLGLATLVQMPVDGRRWWRRRRRRCPRCNHDVSHTDSGRCGECGHDLAQRQRIVRPPRPAAVATVVVLLGLAVASFGTTLVQRVERQSALHVAALHGDVSEIGRAIHLGADIDLTLSIRAGAWKARGTTPIMWACAGGHLETVEQLIDAGADIDIASMSGETALDVAVRFDHEAIVRRLLDAGAVILPRKGRSTMRVAAQHASVEIIEMLLAHGAAVEDDAPAPSPLCIASLLGRIDVMRALLDAGASVDHPSRPLDRAIQSENLEAVRMLLDAGAIVDDQSLFFARATHDPDIIALIETTMKGQ